MPRLTGLVRSDRNPSVYRFYRHRPLLYIFCLAFLLRGLLPPGYMPDFQAMQGDGFKITICTIEGAKQITLDAEGESHGGANGQHADICAFSLAGFADAAPYFILAAISLPRVLAAPTQNTPLEAETFGMAQARAPPGPY